MGPRRPVGPVGPGEAGLEADEGEVAADSKPGALAWISGGRSMRTVSPGTTTLGVTDRAESVATPTSNSYGEWSQSVW